MPLSNKITEVISNELKLDKDKQEVINYGAFALIQVIVSLMFVALFGFIFGVLLESLLVSFTISILRQFSGGMHASKPSICVIMNTIITTSLALGAHYLKNFMSEFIALFLGILVFIWAYYIIYEKAPVDSKAKPITSVKKRKRMRKISLVIISVYILLSLLFIYAYLFLQNNIHIIAYSLCIYGGVAWQIFTLTKTGHNVIEKSDKLFGFFLNRKEKIK